MRQVIDAVRSEWQGPLFLRISSTEYQVPAAEFLRREPGILTDAVGLIENGIQAEEIVRNNRADFVFFGHEMLKDPFWARTAADALNIPIDVPPQYTRYGRPGSVVSLLCPPPPLRSVDGVAPKAGHPA